MADEAFQETVLTALRHIEARVVDVDTRLGGFDTRLGDLDTRLVGFDARFVHLEAGQAKAAQQLSAIVARLEEHEHLFDRVFHKLDRLTTHVATAAQASEEALNAITGLTRRIIKLEHPDDTSLNPPLQG